MFESRLFCRLFPILMIKFNKRVQKVKKKNLPSRELCYSLVDDKCTKIFQLHYANSLAQMFLAISSIVIPHYQT